jgi:hypothetical protein
LNGTFVKLNLPALSVEVERSYWLTGLWICTTAFGTTAPEESTTVPLIVELVLDCAAAYEKHKNTEIAEYTSFL